MDVAAAAQPATVSIHLVLSSAAAACWFPASTWTPNCTALISVFCPLENASERNHRRRIGFQDASIEDLKRAFREPAVKRLRDRGKNLRVRTLACPGSYVI